MIFFFSHAMIIIAEYEIRESEITHRSRESISISSNYKRDDLGNKSDA